MSQSPAPTPPRERGSVRRTSHIDMRRADGSAAGVVLAGAARDLVTNVDGTTGVAAHAQLRAVVGIDQCLAELSTDPVETAAAMLVGRLVGTGFRRAVATSLPLLAERGTPLHLLLDDLPVALLVSGYSLMHAGRGRDATAMAPARPRPDICAGWRTDGSAMLAVSRGGSPPRAVGPVAASVEVPGDPLAWHRMKPLRKGEMRRCRRLDVSTGDVLRIDAAFRDTYVDAGGEERVLHHYSVAAEADPASMEVRRIEATPYTLPYAECAVAAATAAATLGARVPLLRNRVEQSLFGPASCTHLNDLLRSLADAGRLATLL